MKVNLCLRKSTNHGEIGRDFSRGLVLIVLGSTFITFTRVNLTDYVAGTCSVVTIKQSTVISSLTVWIQIFSKWLLL